MNVAKLGLTQTCFFLSFSQEASKLHLFYLATQTVTQVLHVQVNIITLLFVVKATERCPEKM